MRDHDQETLPRRILGMQRLEALFNQNGYLICQLTGERIYDFDEVVAVFIPLGPTNDQVIAVQTLHAPAYIQNCHSTFYQLLKNESIALENNQREIFTE